ncbi:MAG TPA: SIMPL domain-containing protein [Burkholderiaceae bacterium]|nr:SIMPL domain-containing protein [Burkholderiaceae bacterium]
MRTLLTGLALVALALGAAAQTPAPSGRPEGTLVVMPGMAQLQLPNDEALASFYYEVQDADARKAQSQVNARVAEGIAALKRADPAAQIESAGYQSYPVHTQAPGVAPRVSGWRVRQTVSLRTTDLDRLAATVQAGQGVMVLGSLQFQLSRAARDRAEAQLIERAVANVQARVAAAAKALGVPLERVRIEELSFGRRDEFVPPPPMMMRAAMADAAPAPPALEPGQSTESLPVTARVRFLP